MPDRPLRVMHVSQPSEAGVATVVTALVAHQAALGWVPSVACAPDSALAAAVRATGAAVHGWRATRSPGPSTIREAASLRAIIGAAAPDVVHLHSAKAGLAGRLALRGRIPTIYQPHAWSFEAAAGPMKPLSVLWERWAGRWTHRVVCVSDDELLAGRRARVRTEAVVIPNGVDLERWRVGDRHAARSTLGLSDHRTLAVCVGRVCDQKGQDLLLTAWPRVLEKVPNAGLVLIGDGPRAQEWRAAYEQVDGVRWEPYTDPAIWYQAADLVVVPSRWEGMALVPLEAMASARAVVAFAVGGIRQTIGSAGQAVPPEDVDALTAALVAMLASPALCDAQGEAGRARTEEMFTIRKMVEHTATATAAVVRRS